MPPSFADKFSWAEQNNHDQACSTFRGGKCAWLCPANHPLQAHWRWQDISFPISWKDPLMDAKPPHVCTISCKTSVYASRQGHLTEHLLRLLGICADVKALNTAAHMLCYCGRISMTTYTLRPFQSISCDILHHRGGPTRDHTDNVTENDLHKTAKLTVLMLSEKILKKALLYLWVNAERPAAALVHKDGVLGGEVIFGQAPDVPLPDLDRVPKGSRQAELGAAGYTGSFACRHPACQAVCPVH